LVSVDRMCPGLGGQRVESGLECSLPRRRAQQRAYHGEAEACPEGRGRWIGFLGHHVSSKVGIGVKTTVKPLDTLVRRDRRGASSAGGPRSAGNLDSQAPGDGDRREKQQQPAPVLTG